MTEIRFPYIKYLVTPPTIKPAQYVYRPVIPIKLSLGKKVITWDNMPFGLLGQAGFFSHFDVHFNYKEKSILLKY